MTIKDYLNGFTEKDDRIGALSFLDRKSVV